MKTKMTGDNLMTMQELADFLSLSIDCVRHWGKRKYGPPRIVKKVKGRRRVFFAHDAVYTWSVTNGYGTK